MKQFRSMTTQGSWRREVLSGARCLLLIFLFYLVAVASIAARDNDPPTKPCRDSADSYAGYRVNDVRIVTPLSIKTPLGFLFGSQKKLQDEFAERLRDLPIQPGQPFQRIANSESIARLSQRYQELLVTPAERIRVAFITYRLENCDDVARTVNVTYLVYSSEFLYLASRIFENPNDAITRSLAPGKISNPDSLANITNKFLPQPLAGYDRSRELFLGSKASVTTSNNLIDRLAFDVSASHNSAVADMNIVGGRDFASGFLSRLDWRLGYNYYKLPSDPNELKAGTGLAQVFGASQPIGRSDVVFRFGASVEGGNRQTTVNGVPTTDLIAEQSGYGAIKMYAGATANQGRRSWSTSYGLQLGNSGDDLRVDYIKHVVDASYRLRYLWRDHLPLRLETQFSAGAIQTRGPVPVVERFFGGNKPRKFIDGDDWIINSNPFIRSFPQNSLNLVGLDTPIGGENFFSANVMVSQPVWNVPAVPTEISQERDIRDALGGQLRTARQATLKTYIEEGPDYVALYKALLPDPAVPPATAFSGNLEELSQVLDPLSTMTERLKAQLSAPSEVLDAIDAIENDPDFGDDLIGDSRSAIDDAKTDKGAFTAKVKELTIGSTTRRGLIPRLIEGLGKLAGPLQRASLQAELQQTNDAVSKLTSIESLLAPKVEKLVNLGQVKIDVFMPVRAFLKDEAKPDDMVRVVQRMDAIVKEIGERANTLPEVGRSVLLTKADIQNPSQLVNKLKDPDNPLSAFLKTQFDATTRDLLAAHQERQPVSDALVGALVSDLNRIISGPSVFTDDRFSAVDLSDATENLAGQNPQGAALMALNRSLLAEAYAGSITKSQLDQSLEPLAGYISDANDALDVATDDPESSDVDQVRNAVHQLVVGFGELAPPVATSIVSEARKVQASLVKVGLGDQARQLMVESDKLKKLRGEARRAFEGISLSSAEQKADRDIGYAARSLDVIFREMNLLEIAPTVTFDVARIGPPTTPGFGKVHYGLGGGVRFSIVTLDFTAGYAFNLNRQPTEKRGAFILSMTISDLFR